MKLLSILGGATAKGLFDENMKRRIGTQVWAGRIDLSKFGYAMVGP